MKTTLLEQVAPDLYAYDDRSQVLGMRMGHRMTVVRLGEQSGGGLWIHSPVAWSEALAAELDSLAPLGTPRHLVIPSRTHDLHLEPWMQRIPAETTYAPAALQRVHPDWSIGQTLTDDALAPWSQELPHRRLAGAPRVNEVVFFHQPTGTLILTDSVFNLSGPHPLLGGLLLRLNRCHAGISTSRLFRLTIKDAPAFAAAWMQILAWPIERVIVGHGEVIERDQVEAFRAHIAGLVGRPAT